NMSLAVRRGLSRLLSPIATSYPWGQAISPNDTANMGTVGDAIDLTYKKAHGRNPLPAPVGLRGLVTDSDHVLSCTSNRLRRLRFPCWLCHSARSLAPRGSSWQLVITVVTIRAALRGSC